MEQERLFGLIGKTLTHSFSKDYFTEKFAKEQIVNCVYNLYPLDNINLFPLLINENQNLEGLSVTIPYKETIIEFLDELDEAARKVGAVNCVKIIRNNSNATKLIGYNTDIVGFRKSIKPFLESQHEKALILGTGGASKAVAFVLQEIGIDCFFVTRNKNGKDAGINVNHLFDYSDLNENIIKTFKLIINTTPVGMFPNILEAPALIYNYISSSHLLYDLVYNPIETEFLKQGKLHDASVVNGLSMLHIQAEESWRIWNSN